MSLLPSRPALLPSMPPTRPPVKLSGRPPVLLSPPPGARYPEGAAAAGAGRVEPGLCRPRAALPGTAGRAPARGGAAGSAAPQRAAAGGAARYRGQLPAAGGATWPASRRASSSSCKPRSGRRRRWRTPGRVSVRRLPPAGAERGLRAAEHPEGGGPAPRGRPLGADPAPAAGKARRLKRAQEEAQTEVELYRREREQEFRGRQQAVGRGGRRTGCQSLRGVVLLQFSLREGRTV